MPPSICEPTTASKGSSSISDGMIERLNVRSDATPLPLSPPRTLIVPCGSLRSVCTSSVEMSAPEEASSRSEEHTSELQSQFHLVCRLLLEKKKKKNTT